MNPDAEARFSEFVAARQQALLRTAYLLTSDLHSAEDLVQISLAKAYLAWDRLRDPNAVEAYVRKIMVNEHTSWWRRAWRSATRWRSPAASRSSRAASPTSSAAGPARGCWPR